MNAYGSYLLYDHKQPKKAVEFILNALKLEPEEKSFLRNLGKAYARLAYEYIAEDEIQLALQEIEKAIELVPNDSLTHAINGKVLTELKRYQEAEEEVKLAIALNPSKGEGYYWYAELLYTTDNYEKALSYAEKALSVRPEDPDYHHLVGIILWELNRKEEALEKYKQALTIDPKHAHATHNIGVHYLKVKNDPKQALTYFQQALKYIPDQPTFLKHLEKAEQALKDENSPAPP